MEGGGGVGVGGRGEKDVIQKVGDGGAGVEGSGEGREGGAGVRDGGVVEGVAGSGHVDYHRSA